jgi:NAD(P)-dependent dehydrogenase (short-subunit alcohol dehydrogenase family)
MNDRMKNPVPARTVELALVTGGSRGLGRSMVLTLARRGIDSVFTYRTREDEARAVVAAVEALGRKAVALQLDVSESARFAGFAETLRAELRSRWSRDTIDALVNNAGTGLYAPIAQTTEAQFDELVNVHLKSTFFLTQKLLPLIADGGQVLNVSSGLARFSFPGYAAYATMKGGVETLTKYMARELGPKNIRVNVLAPGAIATDFGGGAVRDNPQVQSMLAANTALGRVGQPDDIGPAVAALLSPSMKWMTGQRIELSGGMQL